MGELGGAGPELTPLQMEMAAALDLEGPVGPADMTLRDRLRAIIETAVSDDVRDLIASTGRVSPIVVDRVQLADVLACESFYAEERRRPFSYSISRARGTIAGHVVQRWYFRDRRRPADDWDPVQSVHAVLDEIADEADDKLGEFVASLSPGARAELVGSVLNVVHAFEECWPLLRPRVVRSHVSLRTTLLNGAVVLTYRVAFRFGQPRSVGGGVSAAVVLLDLRPGVEYEEEERFNRWYAALLEVLKVGVAPRRVATWYAETQCAVGEAIDEARLEAAARRVAGGLTRMVEVDSGLREPSVNAGWRCRYCALLGECQQGTAYVARN